MTRILICVRGLVHVQETLLKESAVNPSWRLSLPHVLTGVISSFLFGYHLGYAKISSLSYCLCSEEVCD